MFKVISTGWNCRDWLGSSLLSIKEQSIKDWEVALVYDGGDGGEDFLTGWCRAEGSRWKLHVPPERGHAPKNQWTALQMLDVEDDDIVLWVDLDGDRLAHSEVLEHLATYYEDGTLLTYGNYASIPHDPGCAPPIPFPAHVIESNSYRSYFRDGGSCCFNHLRTMKGRVANAIPESYFKHETDQWYQSGADYIFMISGLELAGPQHKCLTEVLYHYNADHPFPENMTHPGGESIWHSFSRIPLQPLP